MLFCDMALQTTPTFMAKQRVSIKDIAEIAGVSHPTVSRALSGKGRMREATRTRIRTIAADMGYTPSMVARGLVTQRSYTVGLVVGNIADPFHSEVTHGVESVALGAGYSLILATAGVDPDREFEIVRSFQARHVDGIIVSSSRVGNRYAGLLQETGIPIVLVNTHADGDNMHVVYHDDYAGMARIVEHLIARGFRRIAHIGNARGGKAQGERARAWRETMTAAGLEPNLLVHGHSGRFEGGVDAAEQMLAAAEERGAALPDAICCYNDTMAIGAMRVLRRRGYRLPDEIGVTGFDDIDFAAFLEPPLTTWRQPRRLMGEAAMQMMLDLLSTATTRNGRRQRVMGGELVVRASA